MEKHVNPEKCANLKELFEQMRKMNTILLDVASDVSTKKTTTTKLKKKVDAIQERMDGAECLISTVEDAISRLEKGNENHKEKAGHTVESCQRT